MTLGIHNLKAPTPTLSINFQSRRLFPIAVPTFEQVRTKVRLYVHGGHAPKMPMPIAGHTPCRRRLCWKMTPGWRWSRVNTSSPDQTNSSTAAGHQDARISWSSTCSFPALQVRRTADVWTHPSDIHIVASLAKQFKCKLPWLHQTKRLVYFSL